MSKSRWEHALHIDIRGAENGYSIKFTTYEPDPGGHTATKHEVFYIARDRDEARSQIDEWLRDREDW